MAAPPKLATFDDLPVELAIEIMRGFGDSKTADTQRYAPIALLAKRYVRVGRALMMTRVRLRTRQSLRSFVEMLESDPSVVYDVERLSIVATHEARERMWQARRSEHADADGIGPDREELEEVAELVDRVAQLLEQRVATFELTIFLINLSRLRGPSLRALTAGQTVRLIVSGNLSGAVGGMWGEFVEQEGAIVARLVGGVRRLELSCLTSNPHWTTAGEALPSFPGVEHFCAAWGAWATDLTSALAEHMPRLAELTLNTALDAQNRPILTPSSGLAFAAGVQRLNLDSLAHNMGFLSRDLVHFTSLKVLRVTGLDHLHGAALPASLVEMHLRVVGVPAADFAAAIEAPQLVSLRLVAIVTALGAKGWYDDKGMVDARVVMAVCERRGITLRMGA